MPTQTTYTLTIKPDYDKRYILYRHSVALGANGSASSVSEITDPWEWQIDADQTQITSRKAIALDNRKRLRVIVVPTAGGSSFRFSAKGIEKFQFEYRLPFHAAAMLKGNSFIYSPDSIFLGFNSEFLRVEWLLDRSNPIIDFQPRADFALVQDKLFWEVRPYKANTRHRITALVRLEE